MRVAVVQQVEPSSTSYGVAITTISIIQSLIRGGHEVTLCLAGQERARHLGEAETLGIRTEVIPFMLPPAAARLPAPVRRTIKALRMPVRPRLEDFYPTTGMAPAFARLFDRIRPDAVLAYTVRALAATHGLTTVPRMSVAIDLDYLVTRYRWQYTPLTPSLAFVRSALWRLGGRRQLAFMQELLNGADGVVNLAAHHARWLQAHGVPHCQYIPPPTRDRAGRDWWRRRAAVPPRPHPRILMVGHLEGIATLSGLKLFFDETLPALEQQLGPEGFDVQIVGDAAKRPDLVRAVLRPAPSVRLRGYVQDVDHEFLSADILLVPTPIELGMRTRIIDGFSFGCCVVAHQANALGLPQMRHGVNCLLAGDGAALADAVVAVARDPALRERLGRAARAAYEEHFSLETAGAQLTAALERLAGSRAPAGTKERRNVRGEG